jgi:hypothetical protein
MSRVLAGLFGLLACCAFDRDHLEPPDPGFDRFFGSRRLTTTATGFFRTEKIGDRWWLVTPEGHPFFSVGVNALRISGTPTQAGVEHYREAALAKYGTEGAWADAQYQRCLQWGFSTVGAWSQWDLFRSRLPFTVLIDAGESSDYFREDWARSVTDTIQPRARALRDDRYLIGYFLNNEMYWGYGLRGLKHLFEAYLELPIDSSPGKARLLEYLKDRYPTIAELQVDFDTQAATWEALAQQTSLASRDTPGAVATRTGWSAVVAERFFSVTDHALREADPNHLNLGVRFIAQLLPRSVIEVAARYLDVVSINFYELIPGLAEAVQSWEPDYLPVVDFLRHDYEASGRPILITEWSYRAADSVPPNTYPPIFPTLRTQRERADAFEAYYRSVLARPWFVGHHWFLWTDQPPEGRFDGEDSNFGLVTERDEPYPLLVDRAAELYQEIYHRLPWPPG